MPELPEVETIRRGLEPVLTGRTIRGVRFTPEGERLLRGVQAESFRDYVTGRRIIGAERRGKYLLFPLDDGRYFVAHLRMTGRMEVEPSATADGRFFRAALLLDDGNELRWRDVRRFGTWDVADGLDELNRRLGPEPLEDAYTPLLLEAVCRGRRAPIKSVLLDQRRVAGLGNIYVDEALFRARVHPTRPAGSLDGCEIERLHESLRAVLRKGLENFGTTLRDFVNAYGEEGRNQEHLQVYGRKGEPCFVCGTPVERIVVGGRGTHYCPSCQIGSRAESVESGV
ncbi:MAG: bifunctional DNA-formamidopyrimidine glycosylase/DNA-(apurinic or apyrimidinic site) lyase [Dehalococcoidia bacterium]